MKRMKKAKKLIKIHSKHGKILDIGCGNYPILLVNSKFNEKYGIDQTISNVQYKNQSLKLLKHNICSNSILPFPRNFFDVIT